MACPIRFFAEKYFYGNRWRFEFTRSEFDSNAFNKYRRCTFADDQYQDVIPATDGFPPVSQGSLPFAFQLSPRFGLKGKGECNDKIAQSPYRSGMNVVMGDGSVRLLTLATPSSLFWSLVSPNRGEIPPFN
jgi:hypothetical protein